jgi:hypothetical protein
MTRYKSWTLTDVLGDVWLDSFSVGNDSLRLPTPHDWSIRKSTLRGGLRDGVDVVEVHNGALSYTILPTRGMGLWRGEYRGNYLGWRSPVLGPVHPKFVELNDRGGLGWLAGFDEWMCRCGLASNGPPGDDNGQRLTLHGRVANLPVHHVEVRVNLDPPHELSVIGRVDEACLFFGHLSLLTTYATVPGSNRLVIHDVVENRGNRAAELQMLYHCNIGPPFLEGGSRVVTPVREMSPLTARAAEGIDTYDAYTGPVPGYAEQVYCYDPLTDGSGRTLAMLYNASSDRGLVVRFNRNELPCFTVWKNTAAVEDGYVTGLEPATNFPNFRAFERQQGRVRSLPPGGHWEANWSIEVLDSAGAVARVLAEIVSLQSHARPVIHRTPKPGIAPG